VEEIQQAWACQWYINPKKNLSGLQILLELFGEKPAPEQKTLLRTSHLLARKDGCPV